MPNTLKTPLATLITEISNRAQEMALATYTTAEIARHLNRAVYNLRRKHDFVETRTSATVAFTPSTTLPYNTVALSTFSSTAVDVWAPIYLNNATDDYKFWWMEPDALRELARGDRYTYEDVETAFAIDGTNMLIYHSVAETLTFKYYSRYLVATVTTAVPKESFNSDGTTADWFLPSNEELLILGTLLILTNKEPKSEDKYVELKNEFNEVLNEERTQNPSQRAERLEEMRFIG